MSLQGARSIAVTAATLVVLGSGGTLAWAALPIPPPDVQVPPLPAVPTPSLPSVPDVPNVPSVPNVPKPPSPGSLPGGSTSDGGGSISPQVGGSVSGAGAAGGTGSSSAAGGGSSGGGGAGQAGSSERASPKAQRRRQAKHRARERRFRAKVRALSGCFYKLDDGSRRVLTLRAGLHGGRPHSRGQAARKLKTSSARVARLERRGTQALRRAARSDGCGPRGADSGDSRGGAGGLAVASLLSPLGFMTPDSSEAATNRVDPDRGAVLGASVSGGKAVEAVEAAKESSTGRKLTRFALGGPKDGVGRKAAGVVLILLVLVGGGILAREVRKMLRPV